MGGSHFSPFVIAVLVTATQCERQRTRVSAPKVHRYCTEGRATRALMRWVPVTGTGMTNLNAGLKL